MSAPTPDPLSPDLSAFIESAVPSVWALETLLLLRREPGRAWPAERLVAELRANLTLVGDCLSGLERAGLVLRESEAFRIAPASPTLRAMLRGRRPADRESAPAAPVEKTSAAEVTA